jgi:flagellar protein FlaG
MNIPPVATPIALKTDERQVAPAESQAAVSAVPSVTGKAPAAGAQPSREDLAAAVKKINDSLPPSAQSLQFSIDEDSKDIVVKVIDQATREVVRQIPSEEALELAKSLDKMRGMLIRQTA